MIFKKWGLGEEREKNGLLEVRHAFDFDMSIKKW